VTAFICMVRGVNVGGHNKLPMSVLKDLCTSLKLTGVQTYLQSGNVVFSSKRSDRARLSKEIEERLRKKIGLDVKVILRTAAELRRAMAANPYPVGPQRNPSALVIIFLAGEPTGEAKAALEKVCVGPEEVHMAAGELYIHYGSGMGRSKLSNALIERKLGLAGTARNWNTVTRLLELAENLERD
jgi:uncharacterized protein (DUF1697 family)